jgi:hypothetical protein
MSTKLLRFSANGHLTRVKDGDAVAVTTYEEMEDDGLPPMEPYIPELTFSRCGNCDYQLELDYTDHAVSVRKPCPYPDGITSVITLAVPSGKLIVTDDLRPLYNWRDSGGNDPEWMADYNSALGRHQAIAVMAQAGCAFGPVGNSDPGLYRTGDATFAIASPALNEDTDKEIPPKGWERLAGIITDLWAYSIADYGDWLARGGDPATLSLGWKEEIVEVPPGTYEFTCHTGERSFDRDAPGTVIYADIRRLP